MNLNFGERVLVLRLRRYLSTQELADKLGVTTNYLRHFERYASAPTDELSIQRLKKALKLTRPEQVSFLLSGTSAGQEVG